MMVDKTGVGPSSSPHPQSPPESTTGVSESQSESGGQSLANSRDEEGDDEVGREDDDDDDDDDDSKRDSLGSSDKSPGHRARSKSVGEQKWRNVRAVMAYYTRLRKIKRTKSNQRWMKLRTTVQISGAITSTIQKTKPPLKREDSFLKRFSTRQIPETQETVDTGDDGDSGTSQSANNARRRRRRRQQRLPISVINPDENFYFYWLFVLSGCVLYNLWTLIVRQSFPELQSGASVFWFSCDGFSDTIFLLDVAVQFRTGYLEQGLMVYDSKKLAGHYMKSRAFLLDLCSLLPLDLLQINIGVNPILRFPRFLKVYRIYDYYYMVESRTVYPNLWRVVNLIHILLILAHWFGCFYFLLSEAEGFQGDWVYPYRPGDYATLTRKYLGSLYWSTLTLTTIGDLPTPETNSQGIRGSRTRPPSSSSSSSEIGPQARRGLKSRLLQINSNWGYVFTIVSYLIGVFIFATIVGQVGNVITNRNANRLEFERLLDGAKTYMRHHKVPGGMKRRVLRWYDYSWSRGRIQGGGDINTALGLLPDKLKTELALHVNLSVLKKVTIFQECQPEFLHDLVLKMKAYIFTPGDSICRKGEVAREMFIIADGILEVLSETGRVLTTMKAGDFFGEIGILNLDGLNKRTADVRSVGYSELFSLSREDVLAAMKDYPEAQEILQNLGRKRLMEARSVGRSRGGAHLDKGIVLVPTSMIAGGEDSSAGKRIVEKLRSDVKGLKNVLRKSRRGARTKDETFELEPLNPGSVDLGMHYDPTSPTVKGVLRRMSRVRSDEVEDDTEPTSPCEKLGAGLPLLNRLRLLKEKQEREEKGRILPSSPSPSVTTFSPPSIRLEHPPEVIGAGLPLIQRLLLLKQKEAMQTTAAHTAEILATSLKTSKEIVRSPPKELEDMLSSREHSDEESSKKTTSILNRLVLIKNKDSVSKASSSVLGESASETRALLKDKLKLVGNEVKTSEIKPDLTVPKGALFKEKLRLLTHKDMKCGEETKESEAKGEILTQVVSTIPKAPLFKEKLKLLTHKDVKTEDKMREVNAETCPVAVPTVPLLKEKVKIITPKEPSVIIQTSETPAPFKKQESWSVLKKAAILKTPSHSIDSPTDSSSKSNVKKKIFEGKNTLRVNECVVGGPRTNDNSDTFPSKLASQSSSDLEDNLEKRSDEKETILGKRNSNENVDKSEFLRGEGSGGRDRCVSESEGNVKPSTSKKKKPNILQIQQDTKFYMSIDDLSPEYSGLPFVKKLKILNERQKLAELEREVAFVFMRSSSLDSGSGGADDNDPSSLTRSHSEACAMEYVRTQQRSRDNRQQEKAQRPTDLPDTISDQTTTMLSPESNETIERRNLKSILKKLSASSLYSQNSEENSGSGNEDQTEEEVFEAPVVKPSPAEMRKLMRAPTIEGYAARHSKLIKSVTFNRDTLQSPPSSAVTPNESSEIHEHKTTLFTMPIDPAVLGSTKTSQTEIACIAPTSEINAVNEVPEGVASTDSCEEEKFNESPATDRVEAIADDNQTPETSPKVLSPLKNKSPIILGPQHPLSVNQKKFFRPSQMLLPNHETPAEEYFGEVIVGIRQVIQGHLEEIQNKFQTQFQSMELEVKRRDDIIHQLQSRIQELEKPSLGEDDLGEEGDISDMDDVSDQPFMRENSIDTVLTSPPPRLPEDELEEMLVHYRRHPHIGSPRHQQDEHYRHSWEDHSEEETLELQDLPISITPQSIWEPGQSRESRDCSSCQMDSDSVAIRVDSDSEQSEDDDSFTCDEISGYRSHNRDWEVQMLARELDRREDVSQLESEVAVLKAAVSASELSRLSSSELDVLERALAEEDRKISAAARAQSFDSDDSQTEVQSSSRKISRQRSTNGSSSEETLIHRAGGVIKSRLLTRHRNSIRRKLSNAKSLEEETPPQVTNVCRNRSSSSGNIPLPTRSIIAASMRGIGHFVRHGVSTSGQGTSVTRQSSNVDQERSVMTISETCGSSQRTDDPPSPPPDL